MSERDGFQAGVPCWVDTWRPDPDRAAGFYAELLGWEAESRTAPGSAPRYLVCTLRGRDVAAIGSQPSADVPPDWNTYVWVDDVDAVAAKALEAGGSVAREPFESLDAGRTTVLVDPAGAAIGAVQPGHKGAQLVNEPGAWAMSALSTSDVEGAKRFYRAVFGWETESFGEMTMWRLPAYVGGEPAQPVPRDVVAVMAPGGDGDAPPRWSVNFWVHDADAVAAKAPRLGGEVVSPPADAPGFREAVVSDPDGATIAVSQLTAGP